MAAANICGRSLAARVVRNFSENPSIACGATSPPAGPDYESAVCLPRTSPPQLSTLRPRACGQPQRSVAACSVGIRGAQFAMLIYFHRSNCSLFAAAQTWRAPANVTQTLVIPRRASPAGEPYQDGQNFINYTSTESASYPDRLFYKLSAFGKTFLLDLRQDSGFISPTLTVEHVYSEKHRIPYSGHLQHCFYRGQVNQDPVSSAVLNVCNGLVSEVRV